MLNPHAVLDLPQLYTKPSAEALLDTLALLTTGPRSWEYTSTSDEAGNRVDSGEPVVQVNPEGVTRYLTTIISSGLQWIQDDEVKERIFHGGLHPDDGVRKEAWLFLLGVYDWNSSEEERRAN